MRSGLWVVVGLVFLLSVGGVSAFTSSSCGRFVCGNDTYTGGGNLSGVTWANIQMVFSKNYFNNSHGWNQSMTFSNGNITYLWLPWYASSSSLAESNLKDTYTQSLWGVDATWANSTAVTDEGSELAMAAVMNWSGTTVQQFINYLDVCADRDVAHMSQGPFLTSWVCSQSSGNITKNDENSASDGTSRISLALFMACKNPDLNASMRQMACDRALNITRAALAEEWVDSCQNSTVNSSQKLCGWHLAGASQAWGPGALTQVGQQMFFGYHEPNIMDNLAAYAYSHNVSYSDAARNETHQYLFVEGYKNKGNSSGDFNFTTGGANYYLECTAGLCWAKTQGGSDMDDDSDSVRRWEMCNNVEYANITYATFGEPMPWEFVALKRYCQAWTTRMGPVANIADGGTAFANVTSACYRMNNGSTGLCDSTGIIGLNSYKPAGWVSNLVARQENASYYNTFSAGSLSTYSNVSDTYAAEAGFGVYGPVRYLRSIRSATGYYDFLFTNTTYNYTGYAAGMGAAGGGGGGASVPYVGVCVGPINVTVNAPLNNSNTTGSSVLINVTVFNLNNSDSTSNTPGTLPHLLYNSSLCTVDPGFSGDTFSAGTCSINWTSGNMFSADYNLETNYSNGTFQLLVPINYSGGNNNKFHPTSDCASVGGNNRFNFESQNATHYHIKSDRGGFSSTGNYYYNQSQTVNFTTNFTTNVSKACIGVDCTGWEAFTREAGVEDCWSWETGTPGGGTSRFNNFSINEMVTSYTISTVSAGNSSMNISFYAGNNSFLAGQNSTLNATSFVYNWSTAAIQNYSFYVSVSSKDNAVSCTNLSFSVVSSPAGASLGDTIPINMTGNNAPSPFVVWADSGANLNLCWKMFDNNTATPVVAGNQCQISGTTSSAHYVAVDLGRNYSIVNYTLYSQYTWAFGVGTKNWTIQGSLDNITWVDLQYNWTTDAWTTLRTYPLNGSTYRYMRITNLTQGSDHIIQTLSFGVLYLGDPAPILSINLSDEVSGDAIGGFCINATGTNTTQHLCTTGNTVSFNTTGTYNITWFNITAGNTSPRWYNVTLQNFVFSSTQTISNVTYQELLNVSASRVLSNASILSFNVSNDRVSNVTTSGSVLVKARNGTNTVLVSVPGNYSMNISCSGASPFSVNVCNVTGVYDSILSIGAKSGGGAVTNYNLVVNSSVFGSLFSGAVVLNKTLYVLQGYDYGVNVTKSLYSPNVTTLTITNNSVVYNATINPTSLNIVFLDELNRSLVTGVNITAAILFASGTEAIFSTTNGSMSVVGVLDYGSYTIRYGAAAYSLREYTFTLDTSGVNLTLYMIPSTTYAAGVVTVNNYDGLPVSGAIVYLYRYYGDPTIPNIVQTAVTGSDGTTVMTAEAITAYYTFRVDVDGVMRVNTTTPELLTLQADGLWYKTFSLGRNATENMSRYAGFDIVFSPVSTGLVNGTIYDFSTNVSSSIWDVTGCSVYLVDLSSGSVLAGPSTGWCAGSGGDGGVTYETTQSTGKLRLVVNVTTDYFTNSYYQDYGVYSYSNESATLQTFVDDLSGFDKAGFGSFGKFLIAVLVICGVVFSVARSGVLNGEFEGVLVLITLMLIGFSYINWVSLQMVIVDNVGLTWVNQAAANQWILAILSGIITMVALIRKWGGFE